MQAPLGSRRQPGGRSPAPPPLDVIQEFINTRNVEACEDVLATPSDLKRWFAERELVTPDAGVRPSDLDDAIALREALRALLARSGAARLSSPAEKDLRDFGARALLNLDVSATGSLRVQPLQPGIGGALAGLLVRVLDAQQRGTLSRLKVCRNPDCRWAFFDRSRNARGTWCVMNLCGTQSKMRDYRRRRAGAATTPAERT